MDPLLKTAVALAAGSVIVYGAIRRLQTIGSDEFVSTVRITVFLFSAFAVGLFVVDAPVAQDLASELVFVPFAPEGRGRVAGIVLLCVFLIPSIVRILRGERFPEVWEWTLAWVLWPAGLLLATLYAYSIDESGLAPHVVELAWFLVAAVAFAFAHAVFGPVLAAFNLSLILSSLFGAGVLAVSLVDVFEWLGHLGHLLGSSEVGVAGAVHRTRAARRVQSAVDPGAAVGG